MSKLIKKIRKSQKNLENCLVVGNIWGNLDSASDHFKNIFMLLTKEDRIKKRNLIYREDFRDTPMVNSIDYVFIDGKYLGRLPAIQNMITRFRPTIYIGVGEFLEDKNKNFFKDLHYEIVEINKEYQIWKTKGQIK